MARIVRSLALASMFLAALHPAARANPFARFAPPAAELVNGRWNGVNLERRSRCANAQNEGTRGTYAQFDVTTDAAGNFTIDQSGITGLNCAYVGRYVTSGERIGASGTYSCTDGKRGDFEARAIDVNGISLDIQMSIQLTGTESCRIEAILGMARLAPPS
ncbi:MAG TPA: hypothetical protein VEC19_11320 [Usitatibacter sp.]|nr:hypothetical protein [Usitatibacter sp.]